MENRIKEIMALLDCSEAEAKDILIQDKIIDKNGKTDFDLDKEKEKQAMKYTHTGTKTVYKWTPRQRKEDTEKRQIIAILHKFLENSTELSVQNLKISNVERQISFKMGENTYDLTLIKKRKPKT